MRNIKQDNRAKSLQLNPRPRQTNNFNTYEPTPPKSDLDYVRRDRLNMMGSELRVKKLQGGVK